MICPPNQICDRVLHLLASSGSYSSPAFFFVPFCSTTLLEYSYGILVIFFRRSQVQSQCLYVAQGKNTRNLSLLIYTSCFTSLISPRTSSPDAKRIGLLVSEIWEQPLSFHRACASALMLLLQLYISSIHFNPKSRTVHLSPKQCNPSSASLSKTQPLAQGTTLPLHPFDPDQTWTQRSLTKSSVVPMPS